MQLVQGQIVRLKTREELETTPGVARIDRDGGAWEWVGVRLPDSMYDKFKNKPLIVSAEIGTDHRGSRICTYFRFDGWYFWDWMLLPLNNNQIDD